MIPNVVEDDLQSCKIETSIVPTSCCIPFESLAVVGSKNRK